MTPSWPARRPSRATCSSSASTPRPSKPYRVRPPKRIHLWLGSGETETLLTEEFRPYWRRLRWQLAALLDDDSADPETVPEPCAHCEFCEFHETCTERVEGERFPDLRGRAPGCRPVPAGGGRRRDTGPAGSLDRVRSMDVVPERLTRLARQASLQARGPAGPGTAASVRIIEPTGDATWGRGFELMPAARRG